MKKTLIALAALAATGAYAQSSVTISGNLDETYYNQGAASGWIHNGNSTSLWSLSGVEDMGGGMKARFNLVSELNPMKGQVGATSTGAATTTAQTPDIFNRGANIALESGFGTVTVGRQQDLWFTTQGFFNTSGSNSFGFGNLTAQMSNAATVKILNGGSTLAAANAGTGLTGFTGTTGITGVANDGNTGTSMAFVGGVAYATPVFSGFQAQIQSGTNTYSDGGANTGIAYALSYANGPLKLALASSAKNDSTGATTAWTNTVLGATYNLGKATIIAGVNKTSFAGLAAGNNNMTAWALGLNYVVSPAVDINASYGVLSDDTNSNNSATSIGLTGRYKLSNRTQLYAGLGSMNNSGNSTVGNIYGGSFNTPASIAYAATNTTTSAFMLGLKHTF